MTGSAGAGMRVGYLTSQYPATSHTFISREVAALRELGVDLDTFSIRPPHAAELQDAKIESEARRTFTVLTQPWTSFLSAHLLTLAAKPGAYLRTLALATRHRAPGLRAFMLSLAHFAEAVLLARELQRRGITRLHNHFANSGATVGYLAATLLRLPWSFTMHGISETDYPAGLTLGRKIEAADFVACVSYFGRAQAMRLVGPVRWPKLCIVRCGLPMANLPARAESGGVTRFICVGRLSPEKGQAGLLEAFASLCRTQPNVELVFVGDGPDGDWLRARTQALGIVDRVSFVGRLGEEATLEEIARADLLVLPSFLEGLPIVLMEAMAVGTPVIASRVAGIPELVQDGKSGLLFTPSAWDELAKCMERLAADASLRTAFAVAGRSAVADEFDIRRSAEKMERLFAESRAVRAPA
jgi:colanic acid/amylovoran biosynthesis glycosyltransferase